MLGAVLRPKAYKDNLDRHILGTKTAWTTDIALSCVPNRTKTPPRTWCRRASRSVNKRQPRSPRTLLRRTSRSIQEERQPKPLRAWRRRASQSVQRQPKPPRARCRRASPSVQEKNARIGRTSRSVHKKTAWITTYLAPQPFWLKHCLPPLRCNTKAKINHKVGRQRQRRHKARHAGHQTPTSEPLSSAAATGTVYQCIRALAPTHACTVVANTHSGGQGDC